MTQNLPPNPDLDALRDALRVVYRDLAADVARAGPVCDLSGRCCRLADAPKPSRELDDGLTCPWQDAHDRCTAREARPLGCRVYFCDPSYQERSHELSEIYLARLRSMASDFDRPWNYAPLHTHLRSAVAAGNDPGPAA